MSKRPFANISNQLLSSGDEEEAAQNVGADICICRTQEGQQVHMPIQLANLCPMLRNFMGAEFDQAEEIPLPTISRFTLQCVMAYLELYSKRPPRRGFIIPNPPQENANLEAMGFAAWEAAWIRSFNINLAHLVDAADYLALQSLLELCVAQTRLLVAAPREPFRQPAVRLPTTDSDPIVDCTPSPPARLLRSGSDASTMSASLPSLSSHQGTRKQPELPFLRTSCSETSLLPHLCRGKKFLGLCKTCTAPLRGNHSGYCPGCSARRR